MKSKKILFISRVLSIVGITQLSLLIERTIYGSNYIRVINYHSTPEKLIPQFELQLKYFKKYYESVDLNDLDAFFDKKWKNKKPGLILSFDDGLECNYKYASPILEKYNFVGWFFVPTNLIGTGYCNSEHRTGTEKDRYMSLEQVIDLDKRHVIGCHTANHIRLSEEISEMQLKLEIVDSKKALEEILNHTVEIFCWVGGELNSYSKSASLVIKKANYKYAFLTNHRLVNYTTDQCQMNRSNIESDWPLHLVKLYISEIMDLKYIFKRRKTNQLINTDKR